MAAVLEVAVIASLAVSLTALVGVIGLARELALMRVSPIPAAGARMNLRPPTGNRDGLSAGTRAPIVRARSLDGSTVDVPPAPMSVLLFAMVTCNPCEQLLRDVGRRQIETLNGVPFLLIDHGSEADVRKVVAEFGLRESIVIPQEGWDIARKFEIFSAPHAFAISDGVIVAHDTVRDCEHLLNFAESARLGKPAIHGTQTTLQEVLS